MSRLLACCLVLGMLAGCARYGAPRSAPAASPGSGTNATATAGEDAVSIARQAAEAYAKQDWATSERHYVALTAKVPSDVEPWFKLGNIYARTNRFDLAVRAYREVVVRDTRHVRAWHNMGVVQLRQAAQTFDELQKYAPADDPLAIRGAELGRDIGEMLAPTGREGTP